MQLNKGLNNYRYMMFNMEIELDTLECLVLFLSICKKWNDMMNIIIVQRGEYIFIMNNKNIEIHVNHLYKIARDVKLKSNQAIKSFTSAVNFNYIDDAINQSMITDGKVKSVLTNINRQIESYSKAMAVLERERTSEVQEKFDYIEAQGLPNGFAYTLYRSLDDQQDIIQMSLNGKLTDEIVKEHISDMQYDLESRILDRLAMGKELVQTHLNNIFSGNPILSLHFLTILIEELLKSYKGEPSTNKLSSDKSRKGIKDEANKIESKINDLTTSSFHSSELVKKSYDEVLLVKFFMRIKEQKPDELPFNNRNDIVHVYSDMNRYNLLHVYKLLLLISSVLDLFEVLEILNEEE